MFARRAVLQTSRVAARQTPGVANRTVTSTARPVVGNFAAKALAIGI
jgi:hypothetical protein